MNPNDQNDSDDVRIFVTMGGQVSWAVHAYRYMDAVRAEASSEELPQVAEGPDADSNDALWDEYMSPDAPVQERDKQHDIRANDTTLRVDPQRAQPTPSPTSTSRTTNEPGREHGEASISVDLHLASDPGSEMHAAQATQKPQHPPAIATRPDTTSLSREADSSAHPTRTLSRTQVTAGPPHALYASTSYVDSTLALPSYKCTPVGAFSLSATARKNVRAGHPSALHPHANAEASSSSVKIEPDLDDEATSARTSQAGPSRTKGKSVARHAPYTKPRNTATATPPPATGGRGRYSPANPPPGWAVHYKESWTPKWTWNGDGIPKEWNPHDVWERLKKKYNLARQKPCGWWDCRKDATFELRKHVLGVHLGCTYKCRGCGYVYNNRYDNWGSRPAKGVHEAGCPTDAFGRGEITPRALEEALAEIAEQALTEEAAEEADMASEDEDAGDSSDDDDGMPLDADEDE
ncbi:hypothetical protein TRAPUB_12900 [Trametes pubescens]|uniref:Uncharacterized protein n=1 Tax=Trametes pubescens TaxID=154538 RepID=A0A1M2VSM0_TRAPU|nr:hypothetical protein TRAPUB_12900 [Trametes pubescens]